MMKIEVNKKSIFLIENDIDIIKKEIFIVEKEVKN